MTSRMPQTLEALARTGVNLVIDAEGKMPQTLENLVRLTVQAGGSITIRNTGRMIPDTLEKLAHLGRGHLTLEV